LSKTNTISGFHHTAVNVSNMEEAIAFFTEKLGMNLLFEPQEAYGREFENATKVKGARIKFAMLEAGGGDTLFELIEYTRPVSSSRGKKLYDVGAPHIAFQVANITEACKRLEEKGIVFNSSPVNIQAGPLAGRSFVYFPGPDGVLLELFQEKSTGKRKRRRG